ncbi:UDP-galactopyranose mutase [Thermoanaerobacter italicus Ab9]|uniref:UDP-galactopyranose mutase n=1 Tax=Thermoanaerobacter italicus (strain DSM 9252 / Ab9) TaxID=580331 RepID=D3T7L6_THEIA|nr:UDP-galactopyranose mutase [Thermoanaerobacter italicus]ADD01948.1 UDP-galactopyranose mutase [Thermoanaerobacter italicus Ab9]KUJ90237.1 MAG: UDP-galactopyranose mutase [Thermoanaerobacter thermocopriae]
MKYDYVVVGAGIAGITFAENIARRLNKKVLIIEKRNHIGGNCYDEYNENGVLIHKYGPHIFHTNNKKVWDYLSQFTEWNIYYHRVLGSIDGKFVPIPFNLNTLHELLPESSANKLENHLIREFGYGSKVPVLELKHSTNKDLKFLADFIYEKVFLNYTTKQWGMRPEELDPEVTGRVPVYISCDNRYFQDRYQGIPKYGYTKMFEKMLDNKNIHLMLNTDYKEIIDEIKYDKMIYTGPIDYFFDYKHGKLPYRSLYFKFETYQLDQYQPVGTINYPNEYDFTRITEYKHMTGQNHEFTTIVKEYPKDCKSENDIPYYPIPQKENMEICNKYKNEAEKQKNILFVGRLAEYRYYNMDAVVERVLSFFER